MSRRLHHRCLLLRILLVVLALLILTAATRARLSQYENVMAPTGVLAKATKLAECRFDRQLHVAPPVILIEEPAFYAAFSVAMPALSPLPHFLPPVFPPLRT